MIRSLICILALLIAPITRAETKLTPEQSIIFKQLKFEANGKYSDEALKSLAIVESQYTESPFYHEQDIINKLRDKLKMLENDGAYVPNQIQSGEFLPQDDPVDSKTQISEEGFLEAEIHRYVTGEIEGYDHGQLGIEIRRKLDTSESPAKVMIGIRIFATEHFQRPVESTAIVVNSFMDPKEARLKLDQAINAVAKKSAKKLSTRLAPEATNQIMNVVMTAGTVAMVTSMIFVVRKVLRKKSIKFLGVGTLAAWGLTVASYFVVEEFGDLQYLGEHDNEILNEQE